MEYALQTVSKGICDDRPRSKYEICKQGRNGELIVYEIKYSFQSQYVAKYIAHSQKDKNDHIDQDDLSQSIVGFAPGVFNIF
jgi:hypothetical protein